MRISSRNLDKPLERNVFSFAQTSVTFWVESLGRGFCIPGSHPGSREILGKPVHTASCRQTRSSCVNPRTRRVVLAELPNQAWKENSHVHTQRAGYIILGVVPRTCSYTASRCKLVSPQSPILHLHGLTDLELWTVVCFALSYPEPGRSIILQERGKTFNSLFSFLEEDSGGRGYSGIVIKLVLVGYATAFSCRFLGQMA